MAEPLRRFTVIDGGTGAKSNPTFIDTGVVDEGGRPVFRPAQHGSSGPPGDSPMIDIAKLQQSVGWLWKLSIGTIVIGATAIVSSFLILDGRIQNRFDTADDRNREIAKDLGGMKADLARQTFGIEQLLKGQTGDDAKASPRSGEAGPVRKGP